jgi:hypothetical protein
MYRRASKTLPWREYACGMDRMWCQKHRAREEGRKDSVINLKSLTSLVVLRFGNGTTLVIHRAVLAPVLHEREKRGSARLTRVLVVCSGWTQALQCWCLVYGREVFPRSQRFVLCCLL